MKKSLLLCSTHNDFGLIRALRKLGYFIIVTGNKEELPGEKWCDKFIKADYSDKELILKIAQQEKIDAIVQCCNDFGVYTASYVAEKLGLPGYDSYQTTLMLHNKDLFKQFARENNILSPISESFLDRNDALEYVKKANYPVIIKPTDCSAGTGITRADDEKQAVYAIEKAFVKSRAGRIVIEPFINGTQHGYCTFLKDKNVVAVCSNNEYSIINPYRVEIDTFPADNYETVCGILNKQIEKIAKILNLKDGIFHLQYIYDGKTPQIIEVMRRILGNMYHIPGNMLTNLDWEYWETRARCGLNIDAFPQNTIQEGFFAYKTILAPKNGYISDIQIPSKYRKFLYSQYFLKDKGDVISNYLSEPLGFLFFMFPDYKEMKKLLIEDYDEKIVAIKEKGEYK